MRSQRPVDAAVTTSSSYRVGLISDTHSLLRPEAVAFLEGCDRIIHAGDICDAGILDRLGAIAALTAVRGNNDRGPWAVRLPHTADVRVGAVLIRVVHDIEDLGALAGDPCVAGARVVVFGHSHKPTVEERDGILYVNPGSAGPRRFKLPIAVGELLVDGDASTRGSWNSDAAAPSAAATSAAPTFAARLSRWHFLQSVQAALAVRRSQSSRRNFRLGEKKYSPPFMCTKPLKSKPTVPAAASSHCFA